MKQISFRNDVLPLKNILYRLALRITLNREEAEDIVQETLIKVWNRRDSWEEIDSIEAFSLTTCKNLALDHLKKASRISDSLEKAVEERQDAGLSPLEQAQQQDKLAHIKRLVDSLPEKQRSCMQLRDFEGKSYKEIARILELSEEQVKVNIFRARQAIKQKFTTLDKYGL